MARNSNGCGGCGLALLAVFFALPLTLLLVAPAVAAHIVVNGLPAHTTHLSEWQWAATGSLPLSVLLVRSALRRNGRLRGGSPLLKRWWGFLVRGVVLLGAMNAFTFVRMEPAVPGDQVVEDGMPLLVGAALTGLAALVAIVLWDRRPNRVTVAEVRAAAAESDRALRRVRAENERVRRQAEQVQARLVKLRASGPPGRPSRPKKAGRDSEVEFHAVRVFHRESYQCADTAHIAYQSAQTSLHTMAHVVRRARLAPHRLVVSRRARAEMHAAATHLARSQAELRSHVDQGLGMVRTLNATTADLKHEIRDNYGEQGQRWFEALEERIQQAREERRASRIH
ncbi:hypothetical protein ACIA8G_27225 [Lentzea sp. NPDC051213]|uniref:hypothetical protein n=1 Tax=Lentzea sp. NPDC051213 TaxID=3364126 RepID=UPI0037B7C023